MSNTVHVKGISGQTSEKEVRDFFSFCGKIHSLSVTPESGEEKSAQSATVTFEKETAAKTALLLDNTQLGSAQVHVSSAASLDQMSGGKAAGSSEESDDLAQEDKPRSRIMAEYLAQGYVLSDSVVQKALAADQQHGISNRFMNTLQQFDQRTKATERAQAVDQQYQVMARVDAGWRGLTSYFEKAAGTPTGQRLRGFYAQGQRQVLDVHNEAKHLAALKSGKGGDQMGMSGGQSTMPTAEEAEMEKFSAADGKEKTKCNCGGTDSKCPCESDCSHLARHYIIQGLIDNMRAVVLAIVGLAAGSLATIATEGYADTDGRHIKPFECSPHARCCMVNGSPQCLMHDAECDPCTSNTKSTTPSFTPISEIQVRSARDAPSPTPTSVVSTLTAVTEQLSSPSSTVTQANMTATWFDGPTEIQGPNITRTSYDEQSQTIVTETLPATPTGPQPTCDAEGRCVFPPSCSVSFPGFISCHGNDGSITSTFISTTKSSQSAPVERSTTTSTTSSVSTTSNATPATITSIAAAVKNVRFDLRAPSSAVEHEKRQADIAPLLSAIEAIAAASARSSLLQWMLASGGVERQEQTTVSSATVTAPMLLAPTTTVVQVQRQERTTITTVFTATVTAPATVYTTLETANMSQSSSTTDAFSLPPMTAAPSTGYTTSIANASSGIVITNPLRPSWSSTASGWSALNPHINNTSIDTETYLNISTFVMPQSSSQGPVNTTADASRVGQSTVTSTQVIQPSTTDASPTDTGFSGFTPAVTSNLGNHSSGALAFARFPGSGRGVGAGAAIAGLCLGVVVLL
ncbi:Protein vip1 [Friedmanniomyces endolithicus]|uniref:Protein vip1 n=1 Tax=Friedmanniomyces endolithicus TaxID=329885 RepID=A0AAN6KDW1_9PEZI|nr:Protein vip1 [Friedmanniomyces endolithicus]KAK0977396.1 Protein vip1 [Friedmanniomyces endolithicus]KAK1002548.1 Protein vip1 [Friedmanniomyces endolithicus]KAK1051916.1 Protein vip1 [Friedmanniomyces endolithicus]